MQSMAKMSMKAAAGARHSAVDMTMIQAMHDHSVALGAMCDRKNLETAAAAAAHPIKREGGKYVLYSKDGLTKLAEHGTLKAAEEHGQAIQLVLARKKAS
jgi:soluble cytochrome b562